ncbi:hypothetical protein J2Z42_000698 [Clostridium algifaecis]|uniref:Lipoprotein n=1 Tax=Clostridium algifaecis TaxID=1472040 RepID=A0ABS4KPS0_9CLOT|nr:DUF4883 family protein [Clostridium algifaecis]MBP2032033.1 hypothetical protein [Clostridium algifaecis]
MKKLSIIFIIIFLFTGCTDYLNIIPLNSKKPNNFYYTEVLLKNLTSKKPEKCTIIETNFHKEKQLDSTNISDITKMLKSLDDTNFINIPKDLPAKPTYKIIFSFHDQKLLINIYNEKYISVYPWDGDYNMDYISVSKIPISLNLYNLGNYIFKH